MALAAEVQAMSASNAHIVERLTPTLEDSPLPLLTADPPPSAAGGSSPSRTPNGTPRTAPGTESAPGPAGPSRTSPQAGCRQLHRHQSQRKAGRRGLEILGGHQVLRSSGENQYNRGRFLRRAKSRTKKVAQFRMPVPSNCKRFPTLASKHSSA